MKTLLVDGEPEIPHEFLLTSEHTVTIACNGMQTLDLVLEDIKMPEMDGLAFLAKVRNTDINSGRSALKPSR